jgi:hypothetical protein
VKNAEHRTLMAEVLESLFDVGEAVAAAERAPIDDVESL